VIGQRVKQETVYLQEYYQKYRKPPKPPAPEKKRKKDASYSTASYSTSSSSTTSTSSTSSSASYSTTTTNTTFSTSTALVTVEEKITQWDRRIGHIKEKVFGSTAYRRYQKIQTKITGEGPVAEAGRKIKDKVEDLKETFETSQHPLVWKVKDLQDSLLGETETGWALSELLRVDPHFSIISFLEQMEEEMIPDVVKAYLTADIPFIEQVCEGEALITLRAILKERRSKGHVWDDRILYLTNLDFGGATMIDNQPVVSITFICQHIVCVTDKTTGKIVEGAPNKLRGVLYQLFLRRDRTDDDGFGWKVTKMHVQEMLHLTS